jgi:hypothetical protein
LTKAGGANQIVNKDQDNQKISAKTAAQTEKGMEDAYSTSSTKKYQASNGNHDDDDTDIERISESHTPNWYRPWDKAKDRRTRYSEFSNKNYFQNQQEHQNDWNYFGGYGGEGYSSYREINVAPPKTVKEDKYIPEVVATLIKSDKKPLEYLYLPEEVNDRLISYLKTFKESRAQYEKYGFPYRGGILLSGVPGCGKSTTILATATFLDKDIFYLDLGLLKTNNELKLYGLR